MTLWDSVTHSPSADKGKQAGNEWEFALSGRSNSKDTRLSSLSLSSFIIVIIVSCVECRGFIGGRRGAGNTWVAVRVEEGGRRQRRVPRKQVSAGRGIGRVTTGN